MKSLTKVSLAKLVKETQKQVLNGKPYCLFGVTRGIVLPRQKEFGHYSYSRSPELEERFDLLLTDNQFVETRYTDYIGGPVKPVNSCGFSSWEAEITHALRTKEPQNLVYYVRQDEGVTASRILIPISDFYGGLTDEEAITKYGKKLFKEMCKELGPTTISIDADGKVRTPFGDLDYAYKKVIGIRTHPEEWD
ncbi:Uncharacterised protein [uncultured archaeon]|nr:Uncharacterised protein [uncultured archaeon]